MKLSHMTTKVAVAFALPEAEVYGYARKLREEGLIASGGRGPGGAEMTKDDLTNLVMGVLGSQFSKNAAAFVKELRRLKRGKPAIEGDTPNAAFLDMEDLSDSLCSLAEGLREKGDLFNWLKATHPEAPILPRSVEVDFYVDKTEVKVRVERITITNDTRGQGARFDTIRIGFRAGLWKTEIDGKDAAARSGMTDIRRIDFTVLSAIGEIIKELEGDLS